MNITEEQKREMTIIRNLMAEFNSRFLREYGFWPALHQCEPVAKQVGHFANQGVKVRLK